jgi:tetraacyldisaccharide 4'-kinase
VAPKIEENLEEYFLDIVENRRRGKSATAMRAFLRSLSFIFGGVVRFRVWLYTQRILRPHTLGCQVVSVGNLTMGGTGKTPVVEIFARSLAQQGRKVAILSRGYKKEKLPFRERLINKFTFKQDSIPPRIVSNGKRLLLDSRMAGDEPYMLASNLRDVCVLVDKDRVKSGQYAIKHFGCDTLILDDGFQYMRLKHRLDIVLVDSTNPFGKAQTVLPRGILREPIRNIKRAGFIFITKSNGDGSRVLRNKLRSLNPTAEISECRHCPRYLQNVYTGQQETLEFLEGLPVVAVSGIAVPQGFENELTKRGATVLHHKTYADHHRYHQQEIIDLINLSLERGAKAIITTEKDAVRLPHIERLDVPIYYLRVEIEMLSGHEEFDEWVSRICFN